jgi:hypothetical protein
MMSDICAAEPLVPEASLVEVEITIGKLKSYKFPGIDQILAKLIKAGGKTLHSEIYHTIIEESPSYQLPTKFYLTFFWPG